MRCTHKQTRISAPLQRHREVEGKGQLVPKQSESLTGYASQCTTYHTLVRVRFDTTACGAESVTSGIIIIRSKVFESRPELHVTTLLFVTRRNVHDIGLVRHRQAVIVRVIMEYGQCGELDIVEFFRDKICIIKDNCTKNVLFVIILTCNYFNFTRI